MGGSSCSSMREAARTVTPLAPQAAASDGTEGRKAADNSGTAGPFSAVPVFPVPRLYGQLEYQQDEGDADSSMGAAGTSKPNVRPLNILK